MTQPTTVPESRDLQIDFLFLDLDTCTRCRATDATLLEALARIRPALDATGVAINMTKTRVSNEARARELGFVSSPTIRINGIDIAGQLVQSACDTCSEACACAGGIDCRDWIYRGERSTEPPLGLIIEAIMRHAAAGDPSSPHAQPQPRELPENLRQYFAAASAMMVTPAEPDGLDAVRARMHAFITRRVESPDVADDLTQDVLLRQVTNKHGQVENPTAWLYQVARNVIIDHYRTRRSQRRLDADDPAAAGQAEDPFADDPHDAQRELAGCLRSLVDQLDEPYRSAVTAVDLDGQTQTDAARAVGLSVSGMKSRVQRGRRQLGRLLTECCRVHTGPTGSISSYEPSASCEPDPSESGNCVCRIDAH